MKNITLLLAAAVALSPLTALAQNDVIGVVGDYYIRDMENGAESRFYFRLNGGVSSSQLEPCMTGSPNDMVWDINMAAAVAPEMIAMVKRSREEGKAIRVIGTHTVCQSGQSQYGDTAFEMIPNWQPGS